MWISDKDIKNVSSDDLARILGMRAVESALYGQPSAAKVSAILAAHYANIVLNPDKPSSLFTAMFDAGMLS